MHDTAAVIADGVAELGAVLLGRSAAARDRPWSVHVADDPATVLSYRLLRHEAFVVDQGLFPRSDLDDVDDDPRTVVLVARAASGEVLGGVRIAPRHEPDIGWWAGSRLVVRSAGLGVGAALVQAACAHAERLGALRFDAVVQADHAGLFRRLGWQRVGAAEIARRPHVAVRWPIGRTAAAASATKAPLGGLLAGLHLGGSGWVGDDGAPVPDSDLVAACDAIVPSLVERDPEWAGWCGVLVNVNDLAAMGATPVGLLDAVGARDPSSAARVVRGLRAASDAWGCPVLGGHTQFGVPAALSVTALGRARRPVPAGGGRPGHDIRLTADLGGGWRRGHSGRQWDSTTGRTRDQLATMQRFVADTAPRAAKDVSMAGLVGTLGMLAEASGCGAELDVAAVPTPRGATTADWFTCFPGFGMLTADTAGARTADPGPATSVRVGALTVEPGVRLRWPDGAVTTGTDATVTGLGPARATSPS